MQSDSYPYPAHDNFFICPLVVRSYICSPDKGKKKNLNIVYDFYLQEISHFGKGCVDLAGFHPLAKEATVAMNLFSCQKEQSAPIVSYPRITELKGNFTGFS